MLYRLLAEEVKMTMNDQQLAEQMISLTQDIRSLEVEPSPFLNSRILAQFSAPKVEMDNSPNRRSLWFSVASFVSLFLFAISFLILAKNTSDTFNAAVAQPILISVDTDEAIGQHAVTSARIRLPDGTFFYSKRHTELKHQREYRFSAQQIKNHLLSFIIESKDSGIKKVLVEFLNDQNDIISKKEVVIKFNKLS